MPNQKPYTQHFNETEDGLLPKDNDLEIATPFSKVLGFLYGWDFITQIWRKVTVDIGNRIVVVNGGQNINAPKFTVTTVQGGNGGLILASNTNRKAFIIINYGNSFDGNNPTLVNVGYTKPNVVANFFPLPPHAFYYDDTWNGNVYAVTVAGTGGSVYVGEYF